MLSKILCIVALAAVVAAQDPAQGWLAYATATCPEGTRLTHMSAKWKVLGNPQPSSAFYSPWFGADTSDNLNLIQPVNPWFGSSWSFYTEYFQWSPEYNHNSNQQPASTGDQLFGQLNFLGERKQKYEIIQSDLTNGLNSSSVIDVQRGFNGYKNYTILYIVFEKVAQCNQYPPDQKVTFEDIVVECDNKKISPQWTTSYVEDVCNFRAHVESPSQVSITWDTSFQNPTEEQIARSQKSPHMKKRGN